MRTISRLAVVFVFSSLLTVGCNSDNGPNTELPSSRNSVVNFAFAAIDNSCLSSDCPRLFDYIGPDFVSMIVPLGTPDSPLPTITISRGTSVRPESDVAMNLKQPVAYMVTAAKGSTRKYAARTRVLPSSTPFADPSFVERLAASPNLRFLYGPHNGATTEIATLVTSTMATIIHLHGDTGIPSTELDRLESALGPGVDYRP